MDCSFDFANRCCEENVVVDKKTSTMNKSEPTIEDYKQALLHCKANENYPFMLNADGSLKKSIIDFDRKELTAKTSSEHTRTRFTIGNKVYLTETEISVKRQPFLEQYIQELAISNVDVLKFFKETFPAFLNKPMIYHTPNFIGGMSKLGSDLAFKIERTKFTGEDSYLSNPIMKIATIFINETNEVRSDFSKDICDRKIIAFSKGIDENAMLSYGFFFTLASSLYKMYLSNYKG